jgi:hypothetical protein
MSKVFVVDNKKQPLSPIHPGRARVLLSTGKAVVLRRYPFTILLKYVSKQTADESLRIKIDPGSKTTGMALVNDVTGEVVFAAELTHRGEAIKKRLYDRRTCAYCGAENVPLQVEHIVPQAVRIDHRISNLTLACASCNMQKGTQEIRVFLAHKPDVLAMILKQAKAPLADAAAVNSIRWALYERLKTLGLPIECGSGGRTKFERTRQQLPKTHWLDAACVGASTPERLLIQEIIPLLIVAKGYGNRQLCGVNKYGFPVRHRKRQKVHHGYQTGDMIRAVVPIGLKTAGTHRGRVLSRATGSFDIETKCGRVTGVGYRYCHPLHHNDGYSYQKGLQYSFSASF